MHHTVRKQTILKQRIRRRKSFRRREGDKCVPNSSCLPFVHEKAKPI
jgi:hypothetical protein